MLSLPLPGAYSCSDAWGYASTHWEPGFYKTVIKRPGTYTARNTHLSATASFPVFANGFQSWGKPRRHVGRKKNAKSIVTASGYPPNQIEKKTKEIFWLLYSFCIPLWNRWIFFSYSPFLNVCKEIVPWEEANLERVQTLFLIWVDHRFSLDCPHLILTFTGDLLSFKTHSKDLKIKTADVLQLWPKYSNRIKVLLSYQLPAQLLQADTQLPSRTTGSFILYPCETLGHQFAWT